MELNKRAAAPALMGIVAALVTVAVIATQTSALASLPLGMFRTGPQLPEEQVQMIGQEAISGDVLVRLEAAAYSSTETHLILDLHNPDVDESNSGPLFGPIAESWIGLDGIEHSRILQQVAGRGEGGVERRHLIVGPVTNPQDSVVVHLTALCVETSPDGPCEIRHGDWRFEFTPGDIAVDPVSATVAVNQSRTIDGVTVLLHAVQVSSAGLTVSYTVEAGGQEVLPLANLEAVYADGTIEHGQPRESVQEGLTTIVFPLPPSHSPEVTLRMSSVLLSLQDRFRISVRLETGLGGIDLTSPSLARVPVAEPFASFEIKENVMRLQDVEVGEGRFTVTMDNETSGGGDVSFGGELPRVFLVDGLGRSHSPFFVSVGFTKEDTGTISAGREIFSFAEVDLSTLESFELVSESVARVVRGPWEFVIRVP